MSIKERIKDAEILWQVGRKEGAWILALVATAATSRKRYPKKTSGLMDGEAFKSFIRGYVPTIIYGKPSPDGFDAQIIFDKTSFEEIMYKHLRCYLLHEGKLSDLVTFSESKSIDGKLTANLHVGNPIELPDFMVQNLIKVVKEAPENASLFCKTSMESGK